MTIKLCEDDFLLEDDTRTRIIKLLQRYKGGLITTGKINNAQISIAIGWLKDPETRILDTKVSFTVSNCFEWESSPLGINFWGEVDCFLRAKVGKQYLKKDYPSVEVDEAATAKQCMLADRIINLLKKYRSDPHAPLTEQKDIQIDSAIPWLRNPISINNGLYKDLTYYFCWKETPQGHDFWFDIHHYLTKKFGDKYLTYDYPENEIPKDEPQFKHWPPEATAGLGFDMVKLEEVKGSITGQYGTVQPNHCDICGELGSHSFTCPKGKKDGRF